MIDFLRQGRFVLLLLACLCQGFAGLYADNPQQPYVVVLGIAQDAGFPQADCERSCCEAVWKGRQSPQMVTALGIVDPLSGERWMIDATPDFPDQLQILKDSAPASPGRINGVFLTHAHIGHYTGLMHLGREVMGAKEVPVYAMPRMKHFLSNNGPWDQLISLKNIVLNELVPGREVVLNERLRISAFVVPHRDEYSETVGYKISGPKRSLIFIPDIDKWAKWPTPIDSLIGTVDVAYVDGTFYAEGEIPGRNMSEIPHPFIVESMERLAWLSVTERKKVRFIHLNHTNPALREDSQSRQDIQRGGFSVARQGERQSL